MEWSVVWFNIYKSKGSFKKLPREDKYGRLISCKFEMQISLNHEGRTVDWFLLEVEGFFTKISFRGVRTTGSVFFFWKMIGTRTKKVISRRDILVTTDPKVRYNLASSKIQQEQSLLTLVSWRVDAFENVQCCVG